MIARGWNETKLDGLSIKGWWTMKGRKAGREKQRRAGSLPKCYGECGHCHLADECKYYAEWHTDKINAANERELREQVHRWQAEFTRGRVN